VTQQQNTPAGCSKRPSSKAAGESKPEAYPLGYVEDFDELRTKLADFFSILLASCFMQDLIQASPAGSQSRLIVRREFACYASSP
jgi:hypothetical protein